MSALASGPAPGQDSEEQQKQPAPASPFASFEGSKLGETASGGASGFGTPGSQPLLVHEICRTPTDDSRAASSSGQFATASMAFVGDRVLLENDSPSMAGLVTGNGPAGPPGTRQRAGHHVPPSCHLLRARGGGGGRGGGRVGASAATAVDLTELWLECDHEGLVSQVLVRAWYDRADDERHWWQEPPKIRQKSPYAVEVLAAKSARNRRTNRLLYAALLWCQEGGPLGDVNNDAAFFENLPEKLISMWSGGDGGAGLAAAAGGAGGRAADSSLHDSAGGAFEWAQLVTAFAWAGAMLQAWPWRWALITTFLRRVLLLTEERAAAAGGWAALDMRDDI